MSNVPDEVIAAAFEEACMSIHVADDTEGMALNIGDAIAHFCGHSDLGPAREMIYDQSGAAAKAILSALEAAGWVCVPKVPTQQMLEAAASVWKEGYSIGYRHPITRGFSPALGGPSSAEIYAAMLTASRKEKPDV